MTHQYSIWLAKVESEYGASIRRMIHGYVQQSYCQNLTAGAEREGCNPSGKIEVSALSDGLPLYKDYTMKHTASVCAQWQHLLEISSLLDPTDEKYATILYEYAALPERKWPPINFATATMEQQLWCRRLALTAANVWELKLSTRLNEIMEPALFKATHHAILGQVPGYTNELNQRGRADQRTVLPISPAHTASFIEREGLIGALLMYLGLPNHSSDLTHSSQHNPILGKYILKATARGVPPL